MILNILISLGVAIGFIIFVGVGGILIVHVARNIKVFIERKKEEIGLEKWRMIGNIMGWAFLVCWAISFFTFVAYVVIFT